MKTLIIGSLILLSSGILAQDKNAGNKENDSKENGPQKVYSITKERRNKSWYEKQQKLWKVEIDKNKNYADAWYNYFNATRALKNLYWPDDEKMAVYAKKCNEIVAEAIKAIPNTFEANYLQWRNGYNDKKYFSNLVKAYELRPYDPRTYSDLLTEYHMSRNMGKYQQFCEAYFKANELPASILNWAYNMLSELDQNAIVFTCGDNDTFAPWIIQTIKGFRKDVTVLNTSLMLKKDYRDKVFKEIGIPAYTGDVDLQKIKTDSEYTQFVKSLHQHIFDQTPSHPVYVSITCFHQFENDHANKLFLTGLAYKYSEESFDNISLIRRNFEKRYLTDHLKESFDYNIANKIAIQYNAMYLPSLVKLYKHYGKSEELYKQKELRKLLINISEKSGQQGEISEILGSNDKQSLDYFKSALIDVKGIEEKMISLEGNIYMGAHEVSNSDYLKFLSNLLRSRKLELFNTCLYDSAQWVERFKESYNEPMQNLYHAHPAYGDYPVVNIKHEAAVAYCEWLSKQYNSQRKREYTQVRFRLPNEVEWTKAASISESSTSGLPDDNLRDRKGCYLANIKSGEQNYAEDGAMYTAKVDSYKPNEQGFFCIIGNVSEMLNKPGIAKGGSWYHTFNECGLKQLQTYSNCDPGVGFRLVMEVLEK